MLQERIAEESEYQTPVPIQPEHALMKIEDFLRAYHAKEQSTIGANIVTACINRLIEGLQEQATNGALLFVPQLLHETEASLRDRLSPNQFNLVKDALEDSGYKIGQLSDNELLKQLTALARVKRKERIAELGVRDKLNDFIKDIQGIFVPKLGQLRHSTFKQKLESICTNALLEKMGLPAPPNPDTPLGTEFYKAVQDLTEQTNSRFEKTAAKLSGQAQKLERKP